MPVVFAVHCGYAWEPSGDRQPFRLSGTEHMRTAIIHYWLVGMRGGEKVVAALCGLFPQADIYTHVYDPGAVSEIIRSRTVRTTFIQRLPRARSMYKQYLPLMPLALEQLDLRDYELVISSESGPAKGVLTSPDTLHLCYCHTPMRYLWDMYHDYRRTAGRVTSALMVPLAHYLRLWDIASAARVDGFAANSENVGRRIRKHYRRESAVVHPPVDVSACSPDQPREDFYLFVGQLVDYKRADLAVEACARLGRRLVVIGEGECRRDLERKAGKTVTFLGRQPGEVLLEHYARCRALLFPGEEDFGLVPVEAMASGAPVLAYGRGGALETVADGLSGLFFDRQDAESMAACIRAFEARESDFDPRAIAASAQRFSPERFQEGFMRFLNAHPPARQGTPLSHCPREES